MLLPFKPNSTMTRENLTNFAKRTSTVSPLLSPCLSEHSPGTRRPALTDDAFCIGQDGGLATINGLRLGRLPNVPVEWSEINAAWGHALLLLLTIARKWDYTFERCVLPCMSRLSFTSQAYRWRLIPKASLSKLERLQDGAQYDLYSSGDWFGFHRRFNAGQIAFLDCLNQLMSLAKSRESIGRDDEPIRFHHDVDKDKIGGDSIKIGLGYGTDETWTRALRHVLLSLKILLSRVDAPS